MIPPGFDDLMRELPVETRERIINNMMENFDREIKEEKRTDMILGIAGLLSIGLFICLIIFLS